jgi:hypothetical protein
MEKIIENLLWYVPNIDSYQAPKNDLIEDRVYSDFSFTYIMEKMGMEEQRDVLWLNKDENIKDDDWKYFENKICINCQKVIITRYKSLSKTNDFLRCLRNCIAHGQFAIVGDFLIGFNEIKSKKVSDSNIKKESDGIKKVVIKKEPDSAKKAIIKIKPVLLLDALRSLMSGKAKELLVGYAFEKVIVSTILRK